MASDRERKGVGVIRLPHESGPVVRLLAVPLLLIEAVAEGLTGELM